MKDLILITAYTPTPKYEDILERTNLSVKDLGFDILLISHSHTPLKIQKLCQYYFYDHLNDVSQDPNLLGFEWFILDDYEIWSKYRNKNFYGFAIYRMFSMAAKIAKNFGYDRLHHLEYDTQVLDLKIFEEHNQHLENHDAVFYTFNGKTEGFLVGCFKSFNLSNLPQTFENYDKEHMSNTMINLPCVPLENYTKHIFKNLNVKFLASETIKNRIFVENIPDRKKHFTMFYNPFKQKVDFFIKNSWTENQKLMVITNENQIQKINVPPYHWIIRTLCDINDFKSLMIFQDNSLIYEFRINNSDELEIFKLNAFSKMK
jgi:hypothetical protein